MIRLAEVCRQMGDWREAGRLWLTTSAQGPHVDQSIQEFLKRYRGEARQIVRELPAWCFRNSSPPLPEAAAARLRELGLLNAYENEHRRETPIRRRTSLACFTTS